MTVIGIFFRTYEPLPLNYILTIILLKYILYNCELGLDEVPNSYLLLLCLYGRNRGSTHSASASRRGGDRFESKPDTAI